MSERDPIAATPVSVAMATYNGLRWLQPQIDSILSNLRAGDELVIVDDASSDGTWERLLELDDPRVRPVRNEANCGVRATFERALSLTRHDIVFLADQDDVWEPGKRDAFVAEFLADQDCTIVISDSRVIDGDGRITLDSFMATKGGFAGSPVATILRNRYLGCAMAVRRRVVRAALPIPAKVPQHDIWIGLVASVLGRPRYLARPLLRYRRHGGNASPFRSQSIGRMLRWRVDLVTALATRMREWRSQAPVT